MIDAFLSGLIVLFIIAGLPLIYIWHVENVDDKDAQTLYFKAVLPRHPLHVVNTKLDDGCSVVVVK